MNLAFDLAVTPRQDNSGVHRLFVAEQSITEMLNFKLEEPTHFRAVATKPLAGMTTCR